MFLRTCACFPVCHCFPGLFTPGPPLPSSPTFRSTQRGQNRKCLQPWARSPERIRVHACARARSLALNKSGHSGGTVTGVGEKRRAGNTGDAEVQKRDWHRRPYDSRGLPRLLSLLLRRSPSDPPRPAPFAPRGPLHAPRDPIASSSCCRTVNKRCHGRHRARKLDSTGTSILLRLSTFSFFFPSIFFSSFASLHYSVSRLTIDRITRIIPGLTYYALRPRVPFSWKRKCLVFHSGV